ncbi:hypothetical protein Cgig2_013824 [Carnegiea gigantea]|uniref:Post-GPI attachment to proteins factor 3 n=1 Tax=Carnegiea gigantea TaxID=171969 RepID=A0A9Q1JWK3_9CARY|nr:hypothetical protein Cgig2_013824 [Carnegiea gigantea]
MRQVFLTEPLTVLVGRLLDGQSGTDAVQHTGVNIYPGPGYTTWSANNLEMCLVADSGLRGQITIEIRGTGKARKIRVDRYSLNCRDVDLTEKLDYTSAVAVLGYSLIVSIMRSFNVRDEAARVMVAAPLLAFIATHILYLINFKMDYDNGPNSVSCQELGLRNGSGIREIKDSQLYLTTRQDVRKMMGKFAIEQQLLKVDLEVLAPIYCRFEHHHDDKSARERT